MAKSMTGYGRADIIRESASCSVEIRSVNNRYLDYNIRMPRRLGALDANIRHLLSSYIERGKVDVFIGYRNEEEAARAVRLNAPLAAAYLEHYRTIASMDGVDGDVRAADIARSPDVLIMEDTAIEEQDVWEILSVALKEAATRFNEVRTTEGEALKEDILSKLDDLAKGCAEVAAHEPEIIAAYQQKMVDKIRELLEDTSIEEGRIVSEVTMFADRISTDEETVRLSSHIEKMRTSLQEEGSIGRHLDFLAQEMNREANTILSKAGDLVTADTAIALKTGIEKIREQIQNIE